jgi:hypothetical protein
VKICGHHIVFTNATPEKNGKYIWKNSLGIEIITVRHIPETMQYGMTFGNYYGVVEMRNRNVAALRGMFVEIEDV